MPIPASDATDQKNDAVYAQYRVQNLATALRTYEAICSARDMSQSGCIIFVSSPDHLPRVVRDCMGLGLTYSLFMASDFPFSDAGPPAVRIDEPSHKSGGIQ